jgi:Dolichyl-phosphate-mannose-protein mannosyltransferase
LTTQRGEPGGTRTWRTPHSLALAGIAVLGLGWRLSVALSAPWYWDEGYMAELARCLGSLRRPQLGALWQDGFFPLSTSILAPLSAAPLARLPWCTAMTGVRLWAVLLESVALGLVAVLARRHAAPRRALFAAACYAFLPFAVEHGGRAFYHHLAVVFVLLTLVGGQAVFDQDPKGPWARTSLCAGLAVATCYWLWWLPLTWAMLLVSRRPEGWAKALPWMAPAPALALASNVWPDVPGALWSVRSLLWTSSIGGPHSFGEWGRALASDFRVLPFLAVGLAGLAWAAFHEGGRWKWFLVCLAFAVLEPIRQRGDISSMPYPLIPAAPLAALGCAYLIDAALALGRWRGAAVLALSLLLFFKPLNLDWLRLWSSPPDKVAELKGFLDKEGRPGDLVCGLPNFNWALRPEFRVCEPVEVGAAEGRASGFYLPGAPASRFAEPCRLDNIRFAVVTRVHLIGVFKSDGVALSFLEMESRGWPLVFDDQAFKVFENPRFGVKPDPGTRILEDPDYYRLAWKQALLAGRPDLCAFAAARAVATH